MIQNAKKAVAPGIATTRRPVSSPSQAFVIIECQLTFFLYFAGMQIIVSSQNPVKIAATRSAFSAVWPTAACTVKGIKIPSGVSDQPVGDEETHLGALNRASRAQESAPEGDFWVGIEGGIGEGPNGLMAFAWMVVLSPDRRGEARSAAFCLPPAVAALISEGMELGEADDKVFGASNSKQQGGAIGLLTQNQITRSQLYVPPLIMALIPFMQQDLYPLDHAPGLTP